MNRDTTSQQFFEDKYRDHPDPWRFASSEYEQGRYQATFDAISHRRYQRAFEPGCSIGELTARLATICSQVEALDISPTAVEEARQRCRHSHNVNIVAERLPDFIPSGSFDLIVLSEIGYYFDEKQLEQISGTLVDRLLHGGVFIATHWLGTSEDHLLSGDQVHHVLNSLKGLAHLHAERYPGFRIDVWERDVWERDVWERDVWERDVWERDTGERLSQERI